MPQQLDMERFRAIAADVETFARVAMAIDPLLGRIDDVGRIACDATATDDERLAAVYTMAEMLMDTDYRRDQPTAKATA